MQKTSPRLLNRILSDTVLRLIAEAEGRHPSEAKEFLESAGELDRLRVKLARPPMAGYQPRNAA